MQQIYFLKQTDGELGNSAALERLTDYGVLTGDCLGKPSTASGSS